MLCSNRNSKVIFGFLSEEFLFSTLWFTVSVITMTALYVCNQVVFLSNSFSFAMKEFLFTNNWRNCCFMFLLFSNKNSHSRKRLRKYIDAFKEMVKKRLLPLWASIWKNKQILSLNSFLYICIYAWIVNCLAFVLLWACNGLYKRLLSLCIVQRKINRDVDNCKNRHISMRIILVQNNKKREKIREKILF